MKSCFSQRDLQQLPEKKGHEHDHVRPIDSLKWLRIEKKKYRSRPPVTQNTTSCLAAVHCELLKLLSDDDIFLAEHWLLLKKNIPNP